MEGVELYILITFYVSSQVVLKMLTTLPHHSILLNLSELNVVGKATLFVPNFQYAPGAY